MSQVELEAYCAKRNAGNALRRGVAPGNAVGVDRERDLHDQIEAHCKSHGWLYRHDRMDKPTTGQVGFPDFVIFQPNAITTFIECKRRGAKATTAQLATLAHAKKLGYTAEIVDSFELFLQVITK